MALRKFLALVAALTLIALVLAVWFLPDRADFAAENTSWNGLSRLEGSIPVQSLASLDDLPSSPGGSALLIIPCIDFTAVELEKIGEYVAGGGSIFLADDYGYGNRVLAYLGFEARFSGQALLDPLINYKNENFPRVVRFSSDPLTDGADNLTLNHATALIHVDPENVLALSSSFSFLDENGDGTPDAGEPTGPLPVIARQQVGESQIVLVADSSIFINAMAMMNGNTHFIRNIAASATSLYLDRSHLDTTELGRTRDRLAAARRLLASPAGTVVLVAAVVIVPLRPVWHRPGGRWGPRRLWKQLANILERRQT